MKYLVAAQLALGLTLLVGCAGSPPSLTPDELAAGWEQHKGRAVVLAGTPKIVIAERRLALFYTTDGGYRIFAEFAKGAENLKGGQPCRLRGTVKGLETKTVGAERMRVPALTVTATLAAPARAAWATPVVGVTPPKAQGTSNFPDAPNDG